MGIKSRHTFAPLLREIKRLSSLFRSNFWVLKFRFFQVTLLCQSEDIYFFCALIKRIRKANWNKANKSKVNHFYSTTDNQPLTDFFEKSVKRIWWGWKVAILLQPISLKKCVELMRNEWLMSTVERVSSLRDWINRCSTRDGSYCWEVVVIYKVPVNYYTDKFVYYWVDWTNVIIYFTTKSLILAQDER